MSAAQYELDEALAQRLHAIRATHGGVDDDRSSTATGLYDQLSGDTRNAPATEYTAGGNSDPAADQQPRNDTTKHDATRDGRPGKRGRRPARQDNDAPNADNRSAGTSVPADDGRNASRSVKPPASTITAKEAAALRSDLIAALRDYLRIVDELMIATAKGHRRVEIWSNADDEEIGMLADTWLAMAQRNPRSAARVHGAITWHNTVVKRSLFIVPRLYQSWLYYVESGGISLV